MLVEPPPRLEPGTSDAWLLERLPDSAAIEALIAKTGFAHAMRAAAAGVLANHRRSHVSWFFNDRALLQIGYLTLFLHFTADRSDPESGVTLKRMKALCTELGTCSPSRVIAIMALMRFGGYIAPRADTPRLRQRAFVATAQMIELYREHWRATFSAASLLFPRLQEAIDALPRDDFARSFLRALVGHFRSGFRVVQHAPELEIFLSPRAAGLFFLCLLTIAGTEDDTVPPSRPVPIDVAAAARRLGVSSPHIKSILRDAEAAGLIVRKGPRVNVIIQPHGIKAVQRYYASLFIYYGHCAHLALAEI